VIVWEPLASVTRHDAEPVVAGSGPHSVFDPSLKVTVAFRMSPGAPSAASLTVARRSTWPDASVSPA
jgi:hypothetical protein